MSTKYDLDDIETYLEAARQHGEDSEADHEVGDLQDMLREVWELLPANLRATALESEPFRSALYQSYPSDFDEDGKPYDEDDLDEEGDGLDPDL